MRLLICCLFFPLCIQAQDIEINGFHDLRIGTPFSKVKKLLGKKKMESYFIREDDYYEPDPEEECYLCAYQVKLKKKYKSISGIPIHSIEVQFDEEQKISNVLIMIDKSKEDVIWELYGKFLEALGETFCASGVDGAPTYFCGWDNEDDRTEVKIYDWNGIGESDFDEFLWVEYERLR